MRTGAKVGFSAAPFVVVAGLLLALDDSEDRRYVPYKDPAGIWTVCRGITGPEVIPGRTYTGAECDVLEVRYIDRMLSHMGRCVPVELEFHEIKAWGHFAYNIGTDRFCQSTAADLLRRGNNAEACKQILRWRYITVPNIGLFDCSTPGNRTCPGLWDRRQWEYDTCTGSA